MAIRVGHFGGWHLGRRGGRSREQGTATVEQAARAAPQWGSVEARNAAEPRVSMPQPPRPYL